jgi:hypothetical protein
MVEQKKSFKLLKHLGMWQFRRKTGINSTYFAIFESFENAIRNSPQNYEGFQSKASHLTVIGL